MLASPDPSAWLVPLVWVTLGAVAALFLIAWPLAAARRRALAGTLLVVEDLTAGRTGRRADPTGPGELGRLARLVNALAARMAEEENNSHAARQNLANLLRHIDEYVIATDAADAVQLVNTAAEKVFEKPAYELVGRPITSLFAQQDLLDVYQAARRGQEPVDKHLRLMTPRKTIQCYALAAPMFAGPQYIGTLLLLRDLTEITQAMQMKTDFVSNASHELRTPLAGIRAAVETIQEAGADDTDMVKRCVEIIGSQALRLQMMVQDLLDLSRTEDARAVVRTDRVDLAKVCGLVVSLYAGVAAEKRLELKIELADEARTIRGDERLLLLTLKNLVDNALKFTSAGAVTVRSFCRQSVPPLHPGLDLQGALRASGEARGEVVLEVIDSGCGIPREDQQRVFERFYTVSRSRGGADRGTGLGLAIVKHAMGAMGGTVQLESEPNRGTTVRCVFPARMMEAEEEE